MATTTSQSKLQQPWKAWHAVLDPWSRIDVQEGNVALADGDSGHGTTSLGQKNVDLKAHKEMPKLKSGYESIASQPNREVDNHQTPSARVVTGL